ncbi:hypothetical protein H6P81_014226 [Aristolochia fimbriata]|uniref:E2 ubiquitin-conjugating enzyme n=1 Tax=Aristolochia fimbriata TaxID=158543 RepID=A0AAV7ELI9_ARIFI|nr:hypothetical protein H6P81_014226 [Aristolochia fimbriata]
MMSVVLSDSDWDCYSGSSDDEGQDDMESMYGGHAQSILSSLEESIGKIDDFLSFEGGFLPGDIVCSVEHPSGQMGRVVDLDMIVDLEAVSGALIKAVNSKRLLKFRAFASGDYVVCGQWLGKVVKVVDSVTVLFDDGAKCEIRVENPEILEPVSRNSLEDGQYPYYPGQRVRVRLPSMIKCGYKTNQELGVVCHVEVGLVQVNWISCVGVDFSLTGPTPSNLQDPKDLILLACFSYANWQVGDWCLFPFDENGDQEFCIKEQPPHNSEIFSKMYRKSVLKREKPGLDQFFVIVKTKTKVDVIWQDGNYSIGLDAQTLASVDNIGIHEFWPEQFVLKKVLDDNLIFPDVQKVGIVKSMDSKERTVKVKWMPSSPNLVDCNEKHEEEFVSAYELSEHPDFSYCIGDVVVRMGCSENSDGSHPNHGEVHEKRCSSQINNMGIVRGSLGNEHLGGPKENINGNLFRIGIVNGLKDGGVEVKWASGVVSKVAPDEIVGISKPEDVTSSPLSLDDAEAHSPQWMLENDKLSPGLKKEEAADDSGEKLDKDIWDSRAFSLPRAAIGFLANVASSVFGLGLSSSAKSTSFEKLGKSYLDIEDLPSTASSTEISGQTVLKQAGEELLFASISGKSGAFKLFDTVGDYSDHHFVDATSHNAVLSQVKRGWLKKVHQEWQILERDLPDTIYVRVCEERMDLMRAAIVGTPGTPYHDGLFFFDIFFPPDYPNEPPLVHYNSGGLRLNPNLYESGRVCLSLLKTWNGTGTEVWNQDKSTILQVLLSLQALVLNEKPYFNEAGYDRQIGRAEGEKNSTTYNENAFLLSIKTMLYLLRKPPKHFEALVDQHFSNHSHSIFTACEAYMNGASVGRPILLTEADGEVQSSSSTGFRIMLAKLFPKLVSAFVEKGIDCNKFLGQDAKNGLRYRQLFGTTRTVFTAAANMIMKSQSKAFQLLAFSSSSSSSPSRDGLIDSQELLGYGSPATLMTPSCGASSSKKCPEVIDLTSVEVQESRADNRKRKQAVSCDIIEIDEDEVQNEVVIAEEGKNKAIIMGLAEEWHKQVKDALANDLLEFKKEQLSSDPAPSASMEAQDLDYFEKYQEDYADSDEDAYMYSIEEDDDLYSHGNNDDEYEENIDDLYISAQLDAVDLPAGQEASFPWLQHLDAGPSKAVMGASSSQLGQSSCKQKKQQQEVQMQHGTESSNVQNSNRQTEFEKNEKDGESEVQQKFNLFKRFDTVSDFSDHHYSDPNVSHKKSSCGGLLAKKAPKNWSKTIQNEWKLLEKDLPDTIFVRVYEERLDLLRAVIVGAAGTPYHDGLFFFDVCFPSDYPKVPPLVYYYSGGLRLNPNLYNCGKVCLSLLNTWHGNKDERWTPGKSTMLQVLLSIQALVLNAKPYFNEPGWAPEAGQPHGEKKALDYNESTFILSCKTMMYALRRPPKHFEDFVAGHFQLRSHAILQSCKAYMDGAQVGCLVSGGIQDVDEGDKSCSVKFRTAVQEIFPKLIKAFTDNGSDCSKFIS